MRLLPLPFLLLVACHHASDTRSDGGTDLAPCHADGALASPDLNESDLSAIATCAMFTTLVQTDGQPFASAELDSQTITSQPTDVCLHLDAQGLSMPYLHALVSTVPGASSGMTMTLYGPGSAVLAESSDVMFTLDGPASSAQLSWLPAPFDTLDVVLRIVATDAQSHDVDVTITFGPKISG